MPSSLYIHIPYCGSKCSYCDFFSIVQGVPSVPQDYVEALINQFHSFYKTGLLSQLQTVYFGGGTPSLLSCQQLRQIMEEICPLLQEDSEVTLEVNPESLTDELLETAMSCRINRISVGVQSLQDEVLGCVGRRCRAQESRRGLQLLAKSGVAFCIDLIAGLPRQVQEDFLAGLEEVISYKPYHISLYSLTVVEDTRLYKQIEDGQIHWVPEVADSQWIAGRDLLERAGYLQYEVSNFAPVGQESRHNSAYWKQKSYVGLGSGAAGTLYNFGKSGQLWGGFRYTNSTNLQEYLGFWKNFRGDTKDVCSFLQGIPAQKEDLDRKTLAFEHLMLALRMKTGVSCTEFSRRFDQELDHCLFERFCSQGWMHSQIQGYSMTSEGLLFLNQILEELLG